MKGNKAQELPKIGFTLESDPKQPGMRVRWEVMSTNTWKSPVGNKVDGSVGYAQFFWHPGAPERNLELKRTAFFGFMTLQEWNDLERSEGTFEATEDVQVEE